MEEKKKELTAKKKELRKARRKVYGKWVFLTWFTLPLTMVLIAATIIVSMFDNTVTLFVGGSFWELEKEDPNAIYYKSDFETEQERLAHGYELVKQVEGEGAALLFNSQQALPLKQGARVSLFSTSSVNLVYGGTGSANVDSKKANNLRKALELAGMEVNPVLWEFYTEGVGSSYIRDSGGFDHGAKVGEAPWSVYDKQTLDSTASYKDAAIVTLSRVGGEGVDLTFREENYLALQEEEKSMLKGIRELKEQGGVEKIIVLINSSNPLQMDFMKNNEYAIDAVLWIGGVGIAGADAVGEILTGKINPSGSLVDTYCYDNYSAPAMQHFVPITYSGYEEERIPAHASTYMIYQEGIYVGYKYYETRYEDYVMGTGNPGEYHYQNEVAYPFGYGLSYTEFELSDLQMTHQEESSFYQFQVKVTNVGDRAGKKTVQLYVSSPYTEYDIANQVEKASVSLVGFDKTSVLEPGESETLTITVDGDYVASYDAYGAGTYILDAGDYYFTAASNAHEAVNNILAAKGYTKENTGGRMDAEGTRELTVLWHNAVLDTTTYAVSDQGVEIKNRLDNSDPNLNPAVKERVTFLSRANWMGTLPNREIAPLTLTEELEEALQDVQYDAEDYEAYEEIPMPVMGEKNGLKLVDMIGLEYDDPKWELLLNQLTFEEMVSLIGDSFHWTMPVKSVEAPGTRDENGPQGLTVTLFGAGLDVETTALTSEDILAATFHTDLVYEMGKSVGNDCLAAQVAILYGPGANTHRTPYGGRNFEYYSEDSFLSSAMGAAEVKGIEEKGVAVVMKHFALNDSEQDRIGLGVWLTEQTAREIYLRAFQGALEESQTGGNGVMMAYTRWGTLWSGANMGLVRGILKEEWGCNGLQITDNVLTTYVNGVDGVLGGTTTFDAMLAFYITEQLPEYKEDAVVVSAMREACHHNLYAIAHSCGMNGMGPDTSIRIKEPMILTVVRIAALLSGALFLGALGMWVQKSREFKKRIIRIPEEEGR